MQYVSQNPLIGILSTTASPCVAFGGEKPPVAMVHNPYFSCMWQNISIISGHLYTWHVIVSKVTMPLDP